jgi:energy-coupling factor transporter transmembrane protein EcfT
MIMMPKTTHKFGIHPLLKLLGLILVNIAAFLPSFASNRWIILCLEIYLAWLVRLHFFEIKGFFKILGMNFAALYMLFYFATLDWLEAAVVFLDYSLTILIMFLAAFIFTKATPPKELIMALRQIGVPSKMAFTITIAITFLPQITKKIQEIITYQQARGYRFTIFKLTPVLLPAILGILDFSTNLSISLKSRGYSC